MKLRLRGLPEQLGGTMGPKLERDGGRECEPIKHPKTR